MATSLASLANDVSRTHGGRAIRWLGDDGLFYFEDASAAFAAALETSERAPTAGLPLTHIGVHAGPVVFRDGDVYGRTVNVAVSHRPVGHCSGLITGRLRPSCQRSPGAPAETEPATRVAT